MTVIPPHAEFLPLAPNGSYTYADYLTWHYPPYVELIRGWASIRPTPWTRHQQCLGNLLGEIAGFLRQQPASRIRAWMGPLDVRLLATSSDDYQTTTVVLPDLFVVHNPQQIDELGCVGPPDWVIEIVTPGTVARDTRTKLDLYAEAGVGEYWIVFPGERNISVYTLQGNDYQPQGDFCEPGPVPCRTLPELQIQWADVFEGLA